MRNFWIGMAASASLWLGSQAVAAPLTATYEGVLLGTTTPFEATFFYDTDNFVQNPFDNTFFDGVGHQQHATFGLKTANDKVDPATIINFDSSNFFYTQITNGLQPLYTFAIESLSGKYLTLTFSGGFEEGEYILPPPLGMDVGETVLLDPTSVTITSTPVSPVPLPPAMSLFAGALMLLGFVERGTARQRDIARALKRPSSAA